MTQEHPRKGRQVVSCIACLAKLLDGLTDFLQPDGFDGFNKVHFVFGRKVCGSADRRAVEHTITGIKNLAFRRLKIYTHLSAGRHIFSPGGHSRCQRPLHVPENSLPEFPEPVYSDTLWGARFRGIERVCVITVTGRGAPGAEKMANPEAESPDLVYLSQQPFFSCQFSFELFKL